MIKKNQKKKFHKNEERIKGINVKIEKRKNKEKCPNKKNEEKKRKKKREKDKKK